VSERRADARRLRWWAVPALTVVLIGAVLAGACPRPASAYDYPVDDGLLATVVGTAPADRAELPEHVPFEVRRLDRVPGPPVPPSFWNQDRVRYGLVAQDGAAPLIFIVAGTGARFSSEKMRFLAAAFYGAGYHVVALSSPTHSDFILTASSTRMPGLAPEDVRDLYALMKRVHVELQPDLEISGFHLTGYSLGGTHSAFLAALDERERYFGFGRVLLINPAVDLYSSVEILDEMFATALPDGPEGVDRIFQRLLDLVSRYVHARGRAPLDSEMLYHIAEVHPPRDAGLRAVIATVFRLAAANMIFTADTMTGGGHVIEAGTEISVSTSLTPYFKRSVRWPFVRYFDEMLLPYWQARRQGIDRDALIEQASLRSIGPYLEGASHVGVVTNADDFILAGGELDFLRSTFGDRAHVYPTGGHCGNIQYRDNVADMLAFFAATPTTASLRPVESAR